MKLPQIYPTDDIDEMNSNNASVASSAGTSVRPTTPIKKKYSRSRDGPRIINTIIFLREKYLLRDRKLTHQEIDNKESNSFWRDAAATFNNSLIKELEKNLYSDNNIFLDLSFSYWLLNALVILKCFV